MEKFSVFKNYEPGDPNCRIYVKNLAKQVQEKVGKQANEIFIRRAFYQLSSYTYRLISGSQVHFWKIR